MAMTSRVAAVPSDPSDRDVVEANLLLLLNGVDVKHRDWQRGTVRRALDAADVCSLVELVFELFREWQPVSCLDAWTRTARLLGVREVPGPPS
jgi:hypothetical protein